MYLDYDDLPKVKMLKTKDPVMISDSTIRDGSQMPGFVMTKKNKLDIYELLHKTGIEKIESFLFNKRDREVVKEMLNRGHKFPEVTGWARASKKDIDLIIDADGIEETGILMSVSDCHIFDKMSKNSREEAEEMYLDALQYAKDHGIRTRCHLEDITRADFEGFVVPLVKKIMKIDSKSIIRICDTLNFGLPFKEADLPYSIPKQVQVLKKKGVKDIETHVHEDFGLSLANSIAGYWHGANWSNMTFLGFGERAGNANIEKMLLFLVHRVGGYDKYNLRAMKDLSVYVEKELKMRIPRNKAVVGRNIFAHQEGAKSGTVLKHPFSYEPYPPKIIGAKRKLLIRENTSLDVIRLRVQQIIGETLDIKVIIPKKDRRIKEIQKKINNLYKDTGRISSISDDELTNMVISEFLFKKHLGLVFSDDKEEEN